MTELMWVRSHVQQLLGELWQARRIEPDDDGDFPFRSATSMGWVHVVEQEPPLVRVFAHAVAGVRRSAKLLTELNEISSAALSTSVFWDDGAVVVQQTLHPSGLSAPVLGHAIDQVAGSADDIGPLIAGVFGGSTPFPPTVERRDEQAESEPGA